MRSLHMRPITVLSLLTVLAVLAALTLSPALVATAQAVRTGRQIYADACAACHGAAGTGAPQPVVGFDVPLPDFTVCTFTSREPSFDWAAIVHDGGPARAFDRMMPAFGDALTWDEIERVVAYVKSFCKDKAWPAGELNLPRAIATEKAFPEDEAVLTTSIAGGDSPSVANKLIYEQRFGARNQVEIIVPFTAANPGAAGWSSGIGDLGFGAKRAVFHDSARGSILSVAGEIVLPTGSRERGFGKGYTVLEPFVSFGQVLPADSFFQFQGGMEVPFDQDHPNEAFWRMAFGRSFVQNRFGRTWSPMLELVAAKEFENGSGVQWDLLPQVQVTLPVRQHIMAAAGVRFPLNNRDGRSTQFVAYLLWDWFDGGFFEGWRGRQ